jgi:GMP synthase-like glutamine amidotransferase
MMQALGRHYNFKIFSKNEVEDVFFDDVDMVAFPGGMGDSDSWHRILKPNKTKVLNFIARGGRYLGICMGAYWAGSHYFNILEGVDAVQYITQPGTDTRRPHAKAVEVTWNGTSERMFFYDGCALVGPGQYETVATYANGDAMAIYQNRVGIIGCHPESEHFWYNYNYLKPHWHERRHHELLLDFTDQLMRR